MSDDTTTKEPRQLTMPVATVAALVIALVTGLTSGGMASSASSASTREGQIKLEAHLQSLRDEVRRLGDDQRAAVSRIEARLGAHDDRLRAVELHQARQGGGPR